MPAHRLDERKRHDHLGECLRPMVGLERTRQVHPAPMLPIRPRSASLFSGEDWPLLVPTEKAGVFASQWGKDNLGPWTPANRGNEAVDGPFITVDT